MTSGPQPGQPIAALASGSGAGAVAIVRLSGTGCHELLLPCLPWQSWTERQLRLAILSDPETGTVVDDAMVVLFVGPRSYTGEDSAEIHCHGGPYIVRRILELLCQRGARAAEPGEFTKRAFLNGKLDLTAAEGIKALVEAQSHQQWVAARHLTTGHLRAAIDELRQTLVGALAYLAAQIDFADEGDTAHLNLEPVRLRVRDADKQIRRLIGSYDDGRVASQGLRVALFGLPNAGKSTLMNALLGRERAIVAKFAGTTRDYLEEPCSIEGRLIRLVDMAGVRPDATLDPIEAIGIETARQIARDADLVVFLAAADGADPQAQIRAWTDELVPRAHLHVTTKIDLNQPAWSRSGLAISCHTGEGLKEFRTALAAKVDAHIGNLDVEQAFVTSARQVTALKQAAAAISQFFTADSQGAYEELLAFELQQAATSLKSIIGEVGTEDILDRVFGEFCVGK